MPVCILSTYEPIGCFSRNLYQHSAIGGHLAILHNFQVIMDMADIKVCKVAVTLASSNAVLARCLLTELQRICDLHLSTFNNLLNSNL
jgi:hypothetical protein